jgi:cytochrome c553
MMSLAAPHSNPATFGPDCTISSAADPDRYCIESDLGVDTLRTRHDQEQVPELPQPLGAHMKTYQMITAAAVAAIGPLGFIISMAQSQEPPNIPAGAVIGAQGPPGGAPTCAQCRAFNGVSDPSGAFRAWPSQSALYLSKELHDFAPGVRASAQISMVAPVLSPDNTADVSAYYASINAPPRRHSG